MVSSKFRTGVGIREFLEHYLLVLLDEGPSSKRRMMGLILERSSDNENYRPGSALSVADEDIDWAIDLLLQRDCIKSIEEGGGFEIADKGKKALEEADRQKQKIGCLKEDATRKLISLLDPSPPKKYVLDVGTGDGYLAFKVAEAGFKVLGIDSGDFDYSKESVQKAIENIGGRSNIEFQVANVKELTDFQDTFDYVVASQAVHCMKDQAGCIEAIYGLLRKNGEFVCSDLSVGLAGFLHHGFHAFLALSKEEWLSILAQCGYVDVKVYDVHDFCVVEGRRPP